MTARRAGVLLATAALCGCVGGVQGGGNGSGSANGSGSDAAIDAPKLMWPDAANGSGNNLPCENQVIPSPMNGRHNPGKNCFDSCHDHGFTLAGTLYTNATGNTAFTGATITVTDANNKVLKLVTHENGNFYTREAIEFPVLVMASACPSAVKMNVAVAETGRSCNTCHVGATNNQMHLP